MSQDELRAAWDELQTAYWESQRRFESLADVLAAQQKVTDAAGHLIRVVGSAALDKVKL